MEIAIATSTAPAQWRDEDDSTLATALAVLVANAEAVKRAGRHG